MQDVLNNRQFEDVERIGAVRSNGCAAWRIRAHAPKIGKGLAWLPEQRRAGRRGRGNDTVKYDKRRGADEEDEEEILS